MIYELSARYDSRASFYGKAHIKETAKKIYLQSYDTIILVLDKKSKDIKFLCRSEWAYSQTTLRHINEFIKQFTDGHGMSKKEILKKAGIKQ